MPELIVVHIGTMKSGTTYLQNVLRGFDPALREAGWLYPRSWESEREIPSHERAIGGFVGSAIPWVDADAQATRRPAWDRLLAASSDWPGMALLSAEALAVMDERGIETLLGALPARRFRIVLTARDLGRVLPSSWQQHVRNGRTDSYDAYLEAVRVARSDPSAAPAARHFWRSYLLSDVVRRWSAGRGVQELVVATVPQRAPAGELWLRFKAAAGLPSTIPDTPPEIPRVLAHVGATAPEALIVEALVRRLEAEGVPVAERAARARRMLIRTLLPRGERGTVLRLPAGWAEEVADWARADVDGLIASGVRVVGSLDDLLVDDAGVEGPIAPPTEVADAAAFALVGAHADARPSRPRSERAAAGRPLGGILRRLAGLVRPLLKRVLRSR